MSVSGKTHPTDAGGATKIEMVDLHAQYLGIQNEVARAIEDVVEKSAFINGPAVGQFEGELARFLNVGHCIACGSGTDALLAALMAIDLHPGDEVIVPAFTFAAAAEAVALLGGTPVFADVDPRTFNMDPASAERLVSPRTKALVPVHLFGLPCDMSELMKIAQRHEIAVIEDNAQALGAKYRMDDGSERYAGTIGQIGCTSFFPSKVLGCYGDGGAVFTNDDRLAERIRALTNHGQRVKYRHLFVGLNSRLDTIQAAVLRVKLPRLEAWIAARRRAAGYYASQLADLPEVELPIEAPHGTHVYHQYTIKVSAEHRYELKAALERAGIPSMIYYPAPLYEQPAYRDRCIRDPKMRNCERLAASVLSLPMHSELTEAQQDTVVEAIRRYFNEQKTL